MKVQKASRIGIVVGDSELRAAQRVDGRLVTARVPVGPDLKKSVRQLITSSPFSGRDTVIGLEGSAVLVESLVVPAGVSKSPRDVCAERLKGDPVFNEEKAALGVAAASPPGGSGPSMVILAAVNRERISEVMRVCRELELQVNAVEAAALAAWRALPSAGLQVRLLRIGRTDVMLAGSEGKPLFCRIVEAPIASVELRATISRAASLLSSDGFSELVTTGFTDAQRQKLSSDLGLEVKAPDEEIDDPAALGLALDGPILTEFTPPEERELRVKRSVRKVRTSLGLVSAGVVLVVGMIGLQRLSSLGEVKKHYETRAAARAEAERELSAAKAELGQLKALDATLRSAQPGHLMSKVFSTVANATPERMLLEKIGIEDMPKPANEDGTPAGRQLVMRLNGLAEGDETLLSYSEALLETGAFTDVRVENSERVPLGPSGLEGERFLIYARAETR